MKYKINQEYVIVDEHRLYPDEINELIMKINSVIANLNATNARFDSHDIEVADATLRIGCVEFTLAEYREFVREWYRPRNEERTYKPGQWFQHRNGDIYVLASVEVLDKTRVALIGIHTGNRWTDPRHVSNLAAIKLSEATRNPSEFTPTEGETS